MISRFSRLSGIVSIIGLVMSFVPAPSANANTIKAETSPRSPLPPHRSESATTNEKWPAFSGPQTKSTPLASTSNVVWARSLQASYSEDGYKGYVTLKFGDVIRENPKTMLNGISDYRKCDLFSNTTGAIPFEFTLTNETAHFTWDDAPFDIQLWDTSSSQYADSISAFESGSCLPVPADQEYFRYVSLLPNQAVGIYGYFLLPDYYGPEHPNGSPSLIKNTIVMAPFAPSTDDHGISAPLLASERTNCTLAQTCQY